MNTTVHRFMRFTRTVSVLDMRSDEETRRPRAQKFERKNKTGRKGRAVYIAPKFGTHAELLTRRAATFPYGADIFWETRLS